MRLTISKLTVLVLVVALAGCDDFQDRIKSVVYDDPESAVPVPEDDEQAREEQTVQGGDRPRSATELEIGERAREFFGVVEPGQTQWFELRTDGDEPALVDLGIEPDDPQLDPVVHLEVAGDEPPLRYDVAGPGELEEVPLLEVPADAPRRFSISGADDSAGAFQIDVQPRLTAATVATAPNDIPAEARTLEIPGEIQGFYDRPHDRDVFFVDGESLAAGIYTLELSAVPGLKQRLEIYGDEHLEDPLNVVRVGEDAPAVIPNLSLDGDRGDDEGLYFVLSAVDGEYDRQRGYRLRLVEHPDVDHEDFTVEREPNDTGATAQIVEFGETVRGYFHTEDDIDRFRFEIEAPDEGDDEERDEDETDEPTEYDERLVDEDDQTDQEDQDLRPEPVREMLAEQAEFEDPEDVDEIDLREEGVEIVDPWDGIEPREPHDHVARIQVRPLTEAHRLGLHWMPDEQSDHQPRQLRADDEEQPLVVCNKVLGPGEYDLEVESIDAERDFRVRSYDYELMVENIADTPGLEVEPNDRIEDANRLEEGTPRIGFIAQPGDVDYYAFVVGPDEPRLVEREEESQEDDTEADAPWEAPDQLREVEIQLQGNPLDLQFEVMDDEGGRVARVDDGGPGADEELNIDLPDGLYYVAVRAESGAVCEPYELEVTGS